MFPCRVLVDRMDRGGDQARFAPVRRGRPAAAPGDAGDDALQRRPEKILSPAPVRRGRERREAGDDRQRRVGGRQARPLEREIRAAGDRRRRLFSDLLA